MTTNHHPSASHEHRSRHVSARADCMKRTSAFFPGRAEGPVEVPSRQDGTRLAASAAAPRNPFAKSSLQAVLPTFRDATHKKRVSAFSRARPCSQCGDPSREGGPEVNGSSASIQTQQLLKAFRAQHREDRIRERLQRKKAKTGSKGASLQTDILQQVRAEESVVFPAGRATEICDAVGKELEEDVLVLTNFLALFGKELLGVCLPASKTQDFIKTVGRDGLSSEEETLFLRLCRAALDISDVCHARDVSGENGKVMLIPTEPEKVWALLTPLTWPAILLELVEKPSVTHCSPVCEGARQLSTAGAKDCIDCERWRETLIKILREGEVTDVPHHLKIKALRLCCEEASSSTAMHALVDSRLQRQGAMRKRHQAECEKDGRRRAQLQALLMGDMTREGERPCTAGGADVELAEMKALADRRREREESFRHAMQDARVRVEPLGQDRHGRRYWMFPNVAEITVSCWEAGQASEQRIAFKSDSELEALDSFLSHHPQDQGVRRAICRCLPIMHYADTTSLGLASWPDPLVEAVARGLQPRLCTSAGPQENSSSLLFGDMPKAWHAVRLLSPAADRLALLGEKGVRERGDTWGGDGIQAIKEDLLELENMVPWCSIARQTSGEDGTARALANAAGMWVARRKAWREQAQAACDVESLISQALDVAGVLESFPCRPSSAAARSIEGGPWPREGDEEPPFFWEHDRQASAWRALLTGPRGDPGTMRDRKPARHLSFVALAVLLLGQKARDFMGKLKAQADLRAARVAQTRSKPA